MQQISTHPQTPYDVAIIGAGVVGCAIARRLTLEGWHVCVLEKGLDILDGASKGNSAILHTGFDAPPGSLEQSCIAAGYGEYLDIHAELGLSLDRSSALVIAWNEAQEARLPALIEQAHLNGINDVEMLTAERTRALEGELAPTVRASFRVPGEFLIDPWSAPYAYLLQAVENGATLKRNCEVLSGDFDGKDWHLQTSQGPVRCGAVINAAGLYGDIVDQRLVKIQPFTIKPRKGQFIVYDKPASRLTRHILLPVPTKTTKGIVICRTVFGNLLVGPTAEEQESRYDAQLVPETLLALRERGEELLPALKNEDVTAAYCGLRPATQFKDYQIHTPHGQNYVSVGGIRSTGLSSALGIAHHVHELCKAFHERSPIENPIIPQVSNLSEAGPRDWQATDNHGIVCHCERVTQGEIEAALTGPLAVASLAGLKRRTRATLGRCQGNYCLAALAKITGERLDQPIRDTSESV